MATQLTCKKCSRVLEFSGDRPSFCSYCGSALTAAQLDTPSNYDPNAPTVAPSTMPGASSAGSPLPPNPAGYKLLRELGSGGMGTVYEAEDTKSSRHVALKLIGTAFASSADAIERFRQEGLIASMLTHPRCVFVLDVGEDAGRPYIVMELMEGSSLKDLVERQGPLAPDDAVAKILDAIEGLQAAHRLEIIHRDVKPSNCFLETDGRIKVGDFGLAKSLVKESHLTKTGAFVGTPHFASPEQVRGENIDQQTDVYSVAATLFFLLTGKPPFWGSDPTATLARIVADPVPSLRSIRPELPAALDKVVRRGLERDRSRRYADLEELRQALLGLRPGRLTLPGLAMRAAAFALDASVIWVFGYVIMLMVGTLRSAGLTEFVQQAVLAGLFLLYFTILEASWGATLGKGLLGLRVCTPRWLEPPSFAAAAVRNTVFYGCWGAGALIAAALQWSLTFSDWISLIAGWSWAVVGLALAVSTMRPRNHYRGAHELLSGTRVALVARVTQRQSLSGSGGWLLSFLGGRRLKPGMPHGSVLPDYIAGFAIRGALKWTERDKVLLGEDASLGRRVFIWLRPANAALLEPARRDIGRRTRLRWLASGRQGDWQWDAILAPQGCPLPEFIHSEGILDWTETRALLEDLARELSAACAEETLPHALSPALVWVQHDGRAQLADLALTVDTEDSQATGGPDEQRALILLRQVAVLALEGRLLRPQEAPPSLRVALPPGDKEVLDRLLSGGYTTINNVRQDLSHLVTAETAK